MASRHATSAIITNSVNANELLTVFSDLIHAINNLLESKDGQVNLNDAVFHANINSIKELALSSVGVRLTSLPISVVMDD